MKDHVALIDQLGSYRLVLNVVDPVVKTRVIFQMLNVTKAAGRKVIDDENFVAASKIRVGKMRADEPSAAGYEYTQVTVSLAIVFLFR